VLVPDPGAAIVDGVNPTVTPAGSVAVRTTAPLNPLAIVFVNVTGALAPCCTLAASTFAVNTNGAVTVKLTLVVDVSPPPVAVTVIVDVPIAAVAPTAMVNTLDPAPGAARLFDANVAVTPAAAPLTVSVTAPLNPPATLIVAVEAPLPPCRTVTAPADIAAFIDAATTTVASCQKFTRSLPFTDPSPVA
jgi:hypothetical protein